MYAGVCVYTHIYMYMIRRVSVSLHTYAYTCKYMYLYTLTSISRYAYIYIMQIDRQIDTYIHSIHVHTYIHMYACIYIYSIYMYYDIICIQYIYLFIVCTYTVQSHDVTLSHERLVQASAVSARSGTAPCHNISWSVGAWTGH